jgi:hypothetical protein
MDLRKEIFSRKEKLWVLALGNESLVKPLSPLIGTIDWYNNQLLARSLSTGQVKVHFSAKSLLATNGQLHIERILIFGLGEEKDLTQHGKAFMTDLNTLLEGLKEKDPWLVLPPQTPESFVNELHKGMGKFANLARCSVAVA